jgi:predicted phosphohydrolase
MILDKLYCSKRQDAFVIHYHEDKILLSGDEFWIDDINEIKAFLETIEYKPSHKLFSKISVDDYLETLVKLHKVEVK